MIRLNTVVLPAPFGPIRPVQDAAANREAQVLDHGETAEVLAHVVERQDGVRSRSCGLLLVAGITAQAQQAADLRAGDEPLRPHDHHDDEDRGKQHVAPLRAAAQQLRQEREDGRTEQRPDHALRAAEQHIEHDRDRQRDREVLRLDVAEMMRIEPAADAGNAPNRA